MPTIRPRALVPALTASLTLFAAAGCSDVGTHSLAVEGNDAVTAGIDAAASDGWNISFSSFVVVIHNPGLIEQFADKPTWVREAGVTVWDVAAALGEDEALTRWVRATTYDGVDYRLAPASASGYDALAGNVSDDVLSAAVDDDWSVHVVGSAEMGGQTIAFDWTFDTNVFFRCELGDESLELAAEAEETTVLEILGDALFRNDSGDVAFQPIADADGDGDGSVTADELEAAGLLDGVTAMTRALGGVRGLGSCPEYVEPESDDG